jgi:predicted Fe-Mo cluster-binding NifX family protein
VAGPSQIPPTGSSTGGQPSTIPPTGSSTGGQPSTIPPTGSSTAGLPLASTVAGPSTIPPGGPSMSGGGQGTSTAGSPGGQAAVQTPMGGGQTGTSLPGQLPSGARVLGAGVLPFPAATGAATLPSTTTSAGTLPSTTASAGTLPSTTTSTFSGALQGTIDGYCICPVCGARVPHVRGTACYTTACPKCGTPMVRDGSNLFPATGSTGSLTTAPLLGPGGAVTVAGDATGICIAASGPTMDAAVAPLFDRAPYFLIVELGSCKVVANPNVDDRAGVGVQSAQLVVSEGAKAIITNDISLKALEELSKLRIKVYPGVTGTAKEALGWYQDGRLTPSSLNTAEGTEEHSGGGSGGKGRDSKTASSSSGTSSGTSSSSTSSTKRL